MVYELFVSVRSTCCLDPAYRVVYELFVSVRSTCCFDSAHPVVYELFVSVRSACCLRLFLCLKATRTGAVSGWTRAHAGVVQSPGSPDARVERGRVYPAAARWEGPCTGRTPGYLWVPVSAGAATYRPDLYPSPRAGSRSVPSVGSVTMGSRG